VIKGYARVSTDGQTLETQDEAKGGRSDAGLCREDQRSCDRSGSTSAMPSFASPWRCVLVTKLDRLARGTRDLPNSLDAIGKAGASFRSLDDPWADTTTPHGR
jgi:DNA invertase Pin-like site-specific DNA recombinase